MTLTRPLVCTVRVQLYALMYYYYIYCSLMSFDRIWRKVGVYLCYYQKEERARPIQI